MKRELNLLFTAVMFYTRIPLSPWVDHNEDNLSKATKYFPLVGWIVGIVSGFAFVVLHYFLNIHIAVLISMLSTVLLTGAFHEDGLADTCDGFGGGWSKEKILVIMKDSRLGTYGAIGLFFILGLKFLALNAILIDKDSLFVFFVFVSGHAISRFVASTYIFTHKYVRLDAESKAKPVAQPIERKVLLIATAFGLAPLIFFCIYFNQIIFFGALVPLLILRVYLSQYFNKWIGGYTGDCLGAVQQMSEVLFYISLMILWKFI